MPRPWTLGPELGPSPVSHLIIRSIQREAKLRNAVATKHRPQKPLLLHTPEENRPIRTAGRGDGAIGSGGPGGGQAPRYGCAVGKKPSQESYAAQGWLHHWGDTDPRDGTAMWDGPSWLGMGCF
jgi:hypothetical protein